MGPHAGVDETAALLRRRQHEALELLAEDVGQPRQVRGTAADVCMRALLCDAAAAAGTCTCGSA